MGLRLKKTRKGKALQTTGRRKGNAFKTTGNARGQVFEMAGKQYRNCKGYVFKATGNQGDYVLQARRVLEGSAPPGDTGSKSDTRIRWHGIVRGDVWEAKCISDYGKLKWEVSFGRQGHERETRFSLGDF